MVNVVPAKKVLLVNLNEQEKVLLYQLTLLRKLHSSGARLRAQAALETSFEFRSMLYFLQVSTTCITIVIDVYYKYTMPLSMGEKLRHTMEQRYSEG